MPIYLSRPRWHDRAAMVSDPAYEIWRLYRGVSLIYIMACYSMAPYTRTLTWGALYIGKAVDGGRRLRDHEQYPKARRHGFSHLHVIAVDKWELVSLEQVLIETYHPHLNKHHNTDYEYAHRVRGPRIEDEFLFDYLPTWVDTVRNWA